MAINDHKPFMFSRFWPKVPGVMSRVQVPAQSLVSSSEFVSLKTVGKEWEDWEGVWNIKFESSSHSHLSRCLCELQQLRNDMGNIMNRANSQNTQSPFLLSKEMRHLLGDCLMQRVKTFNSRKQCILAYADYLSTGTNIQLSQYLRKLYI